MNDMAFGTLSNYRVNRGAHRILAVAMLLGIACARADVAEAPKWLATWAASDMPAGTGNRKIAALENFTARQVVRSSAGGDSIRLRISNVFGDKPLVIGAATVAVRGEAASVIPATLEAVTFA